MDAAEEFREAVTAHLAGLAPRVDAALARIAGEGSDGLQWLLFEYDSPHFAEEFAVWAFAMHSGDRRAAGQKILTDDSVVVPSEIYDDPRFEDAEPWDTASEILEAWLVERWSRIPEPRPPAFAGHHDSFFKIDLTDGSTVSSDEIKARFAG